MELRPADGPRASAWDRAGAYRSSSAPWILFDPYIESVETTGSHQIKMTLKETLGPDHRGGLASLRHPDESHRGRRPTSRASSTCRRGPAPSSSSMPRWVSRRSTSGNNKLLERRQAAARPAHVGRDARGTDPRWAAIQNGTIHLATELNAATIREAEADANINVDFPEARHFAAIWPNQTPDGPEQFKNALVRQAMASAINKEKLVADVLDPIAYVAARANPVEVEHLGQPGHPQVAARPRQGQGPAGRGRATPTASNSACWCRPAVRGSSSRGTWRP